MDYLPDVLLALVAAAAGAGAAWTSTNMRKSEPTPPHEQLESEPEAMMMAPSSIPHTHEYRTAATERAMGEKIAIKVCWKCSPGEAGRIYREVVETDGRVTG